MSDACGSPWAKSMGPAVFMRRRGPRACASSSQVLPSKSTLCAAVQVVVVEDEGKVTRLTKARAGPEARRDAQGLEVAS